jgi:prolyl-tRNA synthetase
MRALCRRGFASQAAAAPAPPLTPRASSFSAWYGEAVSGAGLVDRSPVRGCHVLRPAGFALWAAIRGALHARVAATPGAAEVYFPLLVPLASLAREAGHGVGFARECAVVTHSRLAGGGAGLAPDPSSALAAPLVVRPTSEAAVWEALRRWVSSHADLPLRLHQWANVLRWERRPRPFLRSAEFLWQEGHTAHADAAGAAAEAARMGALYGAFLQRTLALPSVLGAKSAAERFAGADATLTCEAMAQNGWALQGVAFARQRKTPAAP